MCQISKNYYYEGTDHLTYLGTNEEVTDYSSQLNHDEIQFSGIVDFNTVVIYE